MAGRPRRAPGWLGVLALAVALLAGVLASCSATRGPGAVDPSDPVGLAGAAGSARVSNPGGANTASSPGTVTPPAAASAVTGSDGAATSIPNADIAAIRRTIDAINATAGGSVSAQRAVLERLVRPGDADQQRDCPTAHNTLRLDPVYSDLRRPPDDRPSGAPASTAGTTAPRTSAPGTTAPRTSGEPTTDAGQAGGAVYLLPVLITIFTGDRITGTDLTTLRLLVMDDMARTSHLCVS